MNADRPRPVRCVVPGDAGDRRGLRYGSLGGASNAIADPAPMSGPANTRFTVAVHALAMLAHEHGRDSGGRMSSDRIATSAGANSAYVRRVLGHLRRAGYVQSTSGAHGGWRLGREPADISLSEVWTAITDDQGLIGVHVANPDCAIGRDIQQTLVAIDHRASQAVQDALGRITVADIAPGAANRLRRRLRHAR